MRTLVTPLGFLVAACGLVLVLIALGTTLLTDSADSGALGMGAVGVTFVVIGLLVIGRRVG
jgi:hypothetical protein